MITLVAHHLTHSQLFAGVLFLGQDRARTFSSDDEELETSTDGPAVVSALAHMLEEAASNSKRGAYHFGQNLSANDRLATMEF